MPAAPSPASAPAASLDETLLLGTENFFVRRVALETGGDAALQVELALEAVSPFAVAQLFYGHLVAADGRHALIFATHRRLFDAEAWDGAAAVLPDLVALLGEPPTAAKIRVWQSATATVAATWDGTGELPAHVLARAGTGSEAAAVREELVAELSRRLGAAAPVEEFNGAVTLEPVKGGGVDFILTGGGGRRVVHHGAPSALESMDVRDKAVLAARRATHRRDQLLWRTLQVAIGGLAVALVLEIVLFAGGILLRQQRAAQAQLAPQVERIQTAQSLGTRIDEMVRRRMRPFEMLAVLNAARPAGIQFTRAVTSNQGTIEIEGQTPNADSVGLFESALRAVPAIASLEVRDLRLREGVTTFQMTATFREDALAAVGGAEGAPPSGPAPAGGGR
jgi:hypothetical protein